MWRKRSATAPSEHCESKNWGRAVAKSLRVEEVIEALGELGGSARWPHIEELVTAKRGNSYSPYKDWNNFRKTMFQLIQEHCSDYRKFKGRELFKQGPRGTFAVIDEVPIGIARTSIPPERVHPETVSSDDEYVVGAVRQVLVNAYERDEQARRECIERFGTTCAVCGIDFEKVYGVIGCGFIHVHHKRQLSLREVYILNPAVDLVPVCPNCHSMLHTSEPPLSVEELIELMRRARTDPS